MNAAREPSAVHGFRVEDVPMPDGRTIHYYTWPDDEAEPAEMAGRSVERPVEAAGDEASRV